MMPYQTKSPLLRGSSWREVYKQAILLYKQVLKKTKRKPYIRSSYFKKQKIFFDYFWIHLNQKSRKLKTKRLKYFACAIELIAESHNPPISKENPNDRGEILHRFYGLTKDKNLFYLHIKEERKTGKKYFMSVFSPS